MAKKINILLVVLGKAPCPANVKDTPDTYSDIVGGLIELKCYLSKRAMLICSDERKNLSLPPNKDNPHARD